MSKSIDKYYQRLFKRGLIVQVIAFCGPFAIGETGFGAYYRLIEFFGSELVPTVISIAVSLPLLLYPRFIYSFYKRVHSNRYWIEEQKGQLFFFFFWLLPMFVAPFIYCIVYQDIPFPIFYYGYWVFVAAMLVQYIAYSKIPIGKKKTEILDHLINDE